MSKYVVIVQIILLAGLLYTYYLLTVSNKLNTFYKWVLTFLSIGVLALSDKVKLVMWIIVVAVFWVIHYSKKHKGNGMEL